MTGRRALTFTGLLLAAGAAFFAVFPLWVMRPFHAQDPRQLQLALQLSRWSPWFTAAALLLTLIFVLGSWRRVHSRTARATGILLLVVTAGSAALAHVNIFERMFHPRGAPRFVSNRDAHLDPDDMLMTVRLGEEAHAYPIRTMGYHHVVNDVINRVPVVATY